MSEHVQERDLRAVIEARGWAARLVPAARRLDLWTELEGRLEDGEIDPELFEVYLRGIETALREVPEWARSLLIVAVPDPMVRIRFGWRSREIAVTVPPTYLRWEDRVEGAIERALREGPQGSGHRLAPAAVPKKLLATRSGLARYGRNNVSYVEGMGSFHRLAAFHSSIAADADPWGDPEILPSCGSCRLCLDACPTGAIAEGRFLLHAERCLTYWNEKPTDVPFPDGIDPQVHEQLIGCMRCQVVCPHNHGLLRIEDAEPPLDAQDTERLLAGASIDALPAATAAKVERLGLTPYLDVLPRNLRAVLGTDQT